MLCLGKLEMGAGAVAGQFSNHVTALIHITQAEMPPPIPEKLSDDCRWAPPAPFPTQYPLILDACRLQKQQPSQATLRMRLLRKVLIFVPLRALAPSRQRHAKVEKGAYLAETLRPKYRMHLMYIRRGIPT